MTISRRPAPTAATLAHSAALTRAGAGGVDPGVRLQAAAEVPQPGPGFDVVIGRQLSKVVIHFSSAGGCHLTQ